MPSSELLTSRELARVLASGGDSRTVMSGATRSNKYGCRFEPEVGLLSAGSCTGSTISSVAFEEARAAAMTIPDGDGPQLAWAESRFRSIRQRLRTQFLVDGLDEVDIVITPSGTDAEYVPLVLAGAGAGASVLNIVVAPGEVGGGSTLAAAGRHFDALRPNPHPRAPGDPFGDAVVHVETVNVRTADGTVRDPADIDHAVRKLATEGLRRFDSVIVHVVAHSKTGVHAPSLALIDELQGAMADRLHVVVDAAQGRISRSGLQQAMQDDKIVLLTGSKFYGGPPFSGCVFLPGRYADISLPASVGASLEAYFAPAEAPQRFDGWRAALEGGIANVGLALRWSAALAEIDGYYRIAPDRRLHILNEFERIGTDVFGSTPHLELEMIDGPADLSPHSRLLESKTTVLSFRVTDDRGEPLTPEQLGLVRDGLRNGLDVVESETDIAAIETGQPVVIGEGRIAVLRIALGAQLMRRWAALAHGDVSGCIERDLRVCTLSIARGARRVSGSAA